MDSVEVHEEPDTTTSPHPDKSVTSTRRQALAGGFGALFGSFVGYIGGAKGGLKDGVEIGREGRKIIIDTTPGAPLTIPEGLFSTSTRFARVQGTVEQPKPVANLYTPSLLLTNNAAVTQVEAPDYNRVKKTLSEPATSNEPAHLAGLDGGRALGSLYELALSRNPDTTSWGITVPLGEAFSYFAATKGQTPLIYTIEPTDDDRVGIFKINSETPPSEGTSAYLAICKPQPSVSQKA